MNRKRPEFKYLKLAIVFFIFLKMEIPVLGQSAKQSEEGEKDLYELSLEELMNIPIKSASQKEESLFDAPVDSYSITKDQIKKSGATSIPEALKLCPGVIVRQASNGNYDIHLRGFDKVARYSGAQDQVNLLTLVMIDDRPVFNYNQGGTNWESLPIELIDVERIEIVKGPNAPLFGPNAVTGVINIITKKESSDFRVSSDVSTGTSGTTIASLRAGKKIIEGLDVTVSGNYQKRLRTDDLYYVYDYSTYSSRIDTIFNYSTNYKQSDLAMEKYGINAFVNYSKSEDFNLSLSGGYQNADVQKYYINYGFTSLSPSATHNKYLALTGNYKGLGIKYSVLNGYDNVLKHSLFLVTEYDYTNSNLVVDYDWNIAKNFDLRPSFNYQKAKYSDEKYSGGDKIGLYGGQRDLSSYAFSLKGDYNPTENLRVIAAVRADKFEAPDDYYISYQFAATESLLDGTLLARVVHSKSNSSSFVGNAYVNANITTQAPTQPLPTTISYHHIGNLDYNLPTVKNTELGLRAKVSKNLNVDLTLFHQQLKNTIAFVQTDSSFSVNASGFFIETTSQYLNLPLEAVQNGVTLTVNYVAGPNFQFSPFVTWQKTDVDNIPVHFTSDKSAADNIYNGFDDENRSTPSFYGGFYLNYAPIRKLNINLNSYFFRSHKSFSEFEFNSPNEDIDAKFSANVKVSYSLLDNLSIYANARNAFNADSREQYGTDRMGGIYLFGLDFQLIK